MDAGATFLVELSYTAPLCLVAGVAVVLAWWTRSRSAPLPPMVPNPPRGYAVGPPDRIAYASLVEGRFLPSVDLLGRRLARVVEERYHVQIDQRAGHYPDSIQLPEPLTITGLLDHLLSAYRAAERAESPTWINLGWPWLRRFRQRRAASEFTAVLREAQIAFPALEAA
jgi:hypothetical protein